jgi:single-stranded-DNA-specific exonuclease
MGAVGKFDGVVEARDAYLGVTASVRGLAWRDRLDPAAAKNAAAISQRHGLPELLGRVLASRQVALDEVPVALDPTVKALMPDPSSLRDMDRGAARLADAIEHQEAVAVFGDYDVDGACASALMQRFLAAHALDARIYIPDRLTEGYGPNREAIVRLAQAGARLIVTVDCGTAGIEPLSAAKSLGTEVIVVDHHQADQCLPDVAALINPNRQDDLSGLGDLCAAGLTFMLLVATVRELRRRGYYRPAAPAPDLLALLDLVGLATVCDVVPLKGLNRAYVMKGLEVMRQRRNAGLRALADAAGLAVAPTPYHLGFVLGPRINAGGRIGDAGLGARLLASDDEMETARVARLLDKLNRERKLIEARMLEEAMAGAERLIEADPHLPMVLVAGEGWHQGVVGLIAARLTERFQRPACAIAWDDKGGGTGSLRSIVGVDIGAGVRAAVAAGVLVKGGGHAMAAGLTLQRDRLEALAAFLMRHLAAASAAARAVQSLDIDGALTALSVSDELADLLERAGPYGQGNPQPRFAFPAHRVKFAKVLGGAHVRCVLEAGDGSRLSAIAFRAAGLPVGAALLTGSGLPLHIAGHLRRDSWGGRNRCELVVEDVADPRRQTPAATAQLMLAREG